MRRKTIAVGRTIAAPADVLYDRIANYRDCRARWLPPTRFSRFQVVDGGFGDGTRVRYDLTVFGRHRSIEATVEEVDRDRLLVERDTATGRATAYSLESLGLERTRVTISTAIPLGPGSIGALRGWLVGRFLRTVFREGLMLLAGEEWTRDLGPRAERIAVGTGHGVAVRGSWERGESVCSSGTRGR